MFNTTFKIVYFIGFAVITAVRIFHTTKYRSLKTISCKKTRLDTVLLGLSGIGMLIPVIYILTSVLDFANYRLPNGLGWIGTALLFGSAWLLWASHVHLGRNWTPTLSIRDHHELVTTGIYKHIRHPMYAAHLLWSIAQVLMLHNWIAGYSFVVVAIPQYLLRVNDEEKMMQEQFGKDYSAYMKKTGRIFPRIRRF